jgi:hypothetical protein
MKKKMLMLLMITSIFSCTEIDSRSVSSISNPIKKDNIIGNWILVSSHSELSPESNLDSATKCKKKSILNFNEDGSVTGTVFTNLSNMNCHEEEVNSTWKNNSNINYTIDGSVVDIIFQENNSSFTISCGINVDMCFFKIPHSINTFNKF